MQRSLLLRLTAAAVITAFLQPALLLAAPDPRTDKQKALDAATRKMLDMGWTHTGRHVRAKAADYNGPSVLNAQFGGGKTQGIESDGIYIDWDGWEDDNAMTWSGLVTMVSPAGDVTVDMQVIDFSNNSFPVWLMDQEVFSHFPVDDNGCPNAAVVTQKIDCGQPIKVDLYADGYRVLPIARGRTYIGPNPNPWGVGIPRVNTWRRWQDWGYCLAAGACGGGGAIALLIHLLVSEVPFVGAIWGVACIQSIFQCSANNLWRNSHG